MELTDIEVVERAAQMLDVEMPGWHRHVNVELLDQRSCTVCVLGQLFGGKMEARLQTILGDDVQNVKRYPDGFTTGRIFLSTYRGYSCVGKYAAIAGTAFAGARTCEWRSAILDRQLADEFNQPTNEETSNETDNDAAAPV